MNRVGNIRMEPAITPHRRAQRQQDDLGARPGRARRARRRRPVAELVRDRREDGHRDPLRRRRYRHPAGWPMAMPAACACATTTASQTSTAEPSSSAAAASRPTYRCAPSISARWSAPPRCAGRRTIRATACAWRWPSAPCPGANGAAATPPRSRADWGNFAPRELTDRSNRLSYLYGVMINRRGRRFVDEGEDGAMFTYAKYGRAILAEPGAKA